MERAGLFKDAAVTWSVCGSVCVMGSRTAGFASVPYVLAVGGIWRVLYPPQAMGPAAAVLTLDMHMDLDSCSAGSMKP